MEEQDIKKLWTEYSKLEEKNKLTGTVIRKMIGRQSGSELAIMVQTGYWGVAIYCALLALFGFSLMKYGSDGRFLTVAAAGFLLSLVGLLWGIYTLRRMRSITFSNDSFLAAREAIRNVRSVLKKEYRVQFILMPVFLACVYPVVYILVQGINIFDEFSRVAFRIITSYVFITVMSVWVYRKYYFRNLDRFEERISDAEELESN